jgi:hypothetical protein
MAVSVPRPFRRFVGTIYPTARHRHGSVRFEFDSALGYNELTERRYSASSIRFKTVWAAEDHLSGSYSQVTSCGCDPIRGQPEGQWL